MAREDHSKKPSKKSAFPDIEELASMVGQFFGGMRKVVCDIVDDYKNKRRKETHKSTAHKTTSHPPTSSTTTTSHSGTEKTGKPTHTEHSASSHKHKTDDTK